jgi:hypothetical protein
MRTSRGAALLTAVVVLAASCGSSRKNAVESPGLVIKRHFQDEFADRLGRTWDELHPGHQAIISRSRFVECFRTEATRAKLVFFDVISIADEPIHIAGVPETSSKAVSWMFEARLGSRTSTDRGTSHAVLVKGRWRWVLSPVAVQQIRAGHCPRG